MTDNPLVTVPTSCWICKRIYPLTAYQSEWENYSQGAYAQDAFPTWTASDRELLISHTCGTCFDAIFPEEDEFNTDDEEKWGF